MVRQTLLIGAVLLLSGCSVFTKPEPEVRTEVETQEVFIPVPATVDLPDELEDEYESTGSPEFVSPDNPDAKVALTQEGITDFQLMILDMKKRIRLWEAVYGIGEEEKEKEENESD